MSAKLKQFLIEAYVGHTEGYGRNSRAISSIQIDDQDDDDPLEDFCTVFVTVGKRAEFEVEISGRMPITNAMADLAEIYDGFADRQHGRITMKLTPEKVETLLDLAKMIKDTVRKGNYTENESWERMCARTMSSLRRFVRVVKDYQKSRMRALL